MPWSWLPLATNCAWPCCCWYLQTKYVQVVQELNKQDKDMLVLQEGLDKEMKEAATSECK